MYIAQSRRHFLTTLSAIAAIAALGGRDAVADEGPPEITTIRLAYYPNNCLAPLLVAEDLLRAEGFSEIRYVLLPESFTTPQLEARGDVHFANTFAGTLVSHMDDGAPITALSGVHSGCYELFAHEPSGAAVGSASRTEGRAGNYDALASVDHRPAVQGVGLWLPCQSSARIWLLPIGISRMARRGSPSKPR